MGQMTLPELRAPANVLAIRGRVGETVVTSTQSIATREIGAMECLMEIECCCYEMSQRAPPDSLRGRTYMRRMQPANVPCMSVKHNARYANVPSNVT